MNKNNENAIYRLNTILTLFQVEAASYSVKELAELLQIPASVIRKDIITLHTHDECGITFFNIFSFSNIASFAYTLFTSNNCSSSND